MKETNLGRLLSKLSRSKSAMVFVFAIALTLAGFTTATAQSAILDSNTGLISLDDQQSFPSNGEFTVDISEMNFTSVGEASAYFEHYNAHELFTVNVSSTSEATLTVHYQIYVDVPRPYAYYNDRLENVNIERPGTN